MRTRYHIVASAGISLGVHASLHSWPATIGCFLSGVLIDLDHYLEYFIFRKKIPLHYPDLIDFCYFTKDEEVYLLFHAYEYVVLLWILISYFHEHGAWLGIAIGLTAHLLFDQCFNKTVKPLFYFLTFRLIHQFKKAQVLSEDYFQHQFKER